MRTEIGILNEQDYYRIVYGGWLGKNIGGTLGAPVEGIKELLQLEYYPELPDGPLENDDLDLQLVWLHALEQYGPGLTAAHLAQEWVDHIFFPFDEYGYALTNMRRGLKPPIAGLFNNPFTSCMGSPIRSEIWAMVAPGMPELAARYAYEDAITDHAGGEGVYGEMFFAALESAIFFEKDRDALIAIGMKFIPPDCRTALAIQDLLRWHKEGKEWKVARELILEHHGSENFTDTPQNIAFTLLGWLYGDDFEDAILKAVNCGYDTDCTAATLAAILGMILGPEGLPAKWVDPVGNKVVVSPPIKGFPYPVTLEELTGRTIAMGRQILAYAGSPILIRSDAPSKLDYRAEADESLEPLWTRDPAVDIRYLPEGSQKHALLKVEIRYEGNDPSIGAGCEKKLQFTIANTATISLAFRLELLLPKDWTGEDMQAITLAAGESYIWDTTVHASQSLQQAAYNLQLQFTRLHNYSEWAQYHATFALVRAYGWLVSGPDGSNEQPAWIPGNRMLLDEITGLQAQGWYTGRTMLHNPLDRRICLIVSAPGAVRLKLGGETVLETTGAADWLPAYHRGAEGQRVELNLTAGDHRLEVEALREERPLELYVMMVAPADTEEPGFCYNLNDLLLDLPRN
ncbi:ADP-ribosylglycohydrolase family protein [Paenibacillus paridis]|uniref:ADP-ribosylglycohydrolase family protein n=1 Tax=Paenibacillus paridis TaxID=2583376 RepID=UPI00139180AC|nr:ADP-ribosylglycohydrolase family protein [Paenibacillus paridis]